MWVDLKWNTLRCIPEDRHLYNDLYENLKLQNKLITYIPILCWTYPLIRGIRNTGIYTLRLGKWFYSRFRAIGCHTDICYHFLFLILMTMVGIERRTF
jgi:hypothetical protein